MKMAGIEELFLLNTDTVYVSLRSLSQSYLSDVNVYREGAGVISQLMWWQTVLTFYINQSDIHSNSKTTR